MANEIHTFTVTAKTDVWTGDATAKTDGTGDADANRKGKKLILTGLLGSIRWWFEVLVRGLGGPACDPTATKCLDRKHCAVCELFGCTGWARKFRFQVLDEQDAPLDTQIKKGKTFKLRFIPLRPVAEEEWALLEATLNLISKYGAIGGKTVFKPSDESGREGKEQHKDYGIVEVTIPRHLGDTNRATLEGYLSGPKFRKPDTEELVWASLQNFWFVSGKYLTRQGVDRSTFNSVIGRKESKRQSSGNDSWLAGSQQKSKKVFSFKSPKRTFGFVNPAPTNGLDPVINFSDIKQRLANVWGQNGWDFLSGEQIINGLFAGEEDHS